jgi:hypothetical protein
MIPTTPLDVYTNTNALNEIHGQSARAHVIVDVIHPIGVVVLQLEVVVLLRCHDLRDTHIRMTTHEERSWPRHPTLTLA